MQQVKQSLQVRSQESPEYEYVTTTLHELIEAINEALQPGEEKLLWWIVSALIEDRRIQFVENSPGQRTKELINKKRRYGHEKNWRIVPNRGLESREARPGY